MTNNKPSVTSHPSPVDVALDLVAPPATPIPGEASDTIGVPSPRHVLVATLGIGCDVADEMLANLQEEVGPELVAIYLSDKPGKDVRIRQLLAELT
jgi:hypothetical protein